MRWLALCVAAACSTDPFTSSDGGFEASTDASSHDVAIADVGVDACTGDGLECAAGQLCTSFDTDLTNLTPFVDGSGAPGFVTITPTQFFTCPNALLTTLPGIANATGAVRAVITGSGSFTPATSAHALLELDVFLPSTTHGAASFLALRPTGDLASAVTVSVEDGGAWMIHVRASNQDVPISPLVGAWNHMMLDVVFTATGAQGSASLMYLDETASIVTQKTPGSTLATGVPIGSITAEIGINPVGNTTAQMIAYYDDVAFSPPP